MSEGSQPIRARLIYLSISFKKEGTFILWLQIYYLPLYKYIIVWKFGNQY